MMDDDSFTDTMTEIEEDAWNAFKEVVKKFVGNIKDPLYKEIVRNMLEKFKLLGCNMSLKLHFIASHLDYFPQNLGTVSEEQGERFHQDLKDVERRYQGHWDVNMMADYVGRLHVKTLPESTQEVQEHTNSTGNGKGRPRNSNVHFQGV
jgi:hypothetical protein